MSEQPDPVQLLPPSVDSNPSSPEPSAPDVLPPQPELPPEPPAQPQSYTQPQAQYAQPQQHIEPQAQPPQAQPPQAQPPQAQPPQAQPPQAQPPQAQPPQAQPPQAQPPQVQPPQAQPPQAQPSQAQPQQPIVYAQPQAQPQQPIVYAQPQAQPQQPIVYAQPQAQPQQYLQPQPQAAATGATAGPTLITEAPPTYSDVIQQPKHGTYPVQQGTVPVQHGTYPVQQGTYPVQYFQQPGQPQFVYLQQPGARPGAQTMPYVVQAPLQPVAALPRPSYPGPHDFLIIAVITTTFCAFLNITSLMFGIPAVIFAIQSKNYKDTANYPAAKQNANIALGLTITTIIYTLGLAAFFIGLSEGLYFRGQCSFLRFSRSNNEYSC